MDLNSRIHAVELRYTTMSQHLLVTNQNMIQQYKTTSKDTKAINDELKIIRDDLFKIKEIIKKMASEMSNFAKKTEIKVLEKYINLWNPMNFVTEDQIKKLIKEGEENRLSNK